MGMMIDLQPSAGPALVVGGGKIALRKARNLVEGGFAVTVVAPAVLEELRELAGLTIEERPFADADLEREEWALVFACTDNREVNRRVGEYAHALGLLVVVADAQAESTFFTPAVLREAGVSVAVSTGGADPARARLLRERIAATLERCRAAQGEVEHAIRAGRRRA